MPAAMSDECCDDAARQVRRTIPRHPGGVISLGSLGGESRIDGYSMRRHVVRRYPFVTLAGCLDMADAGKGQVGGGGPIALPGCVRIRFLALRGRCFRV